MNTDRVRASVTELEATSEKSGLIGVKDPQKGLIIKEVLGVDVCEFVYNPIVLKGVLTSIKEEAIRRAEKYVTRKELLAGYARRESTLKIDAARSKSMTMADKDSPLTYGTLGWLWHNLPITVWFKLAGILIFVFLVGLYASGIPTVKNILSYVPGYKAQLLLPPETSRTVQNAITELVNKHSERIAKLQASIVGERELAGMALEAYDHERQAEAIKKLMDEENVTFEKELGLLKALLEK